MEVKEKLSHYLEDRDNEFIVIASIHTYLMSKTLFYSLFGTLGLISRIWPLETTDLMSPSNLNSPIAPTRVATEMTEGDIFLS